MRLSQSTLWNIYESVNNNTCIKPNWAAAALRLRWLCPPQSEKRMCHLQSQNMAYLPLIWHESSSAAIFLAGWRERTAPSPSCLLPGSSRSHIAWAAKPKHTRCQKIKHTPPLITNHESVPSEINKTGDAIQFIWEGPLARRLEWTFYVADMVILSLYQHETKKPSGP